MKSNIFLSQAPVRNESIIGAQIYSHSGEFSPQVRDFYLPSRGDSFQFLRKYRSATHQEVGPLGHGWTFSYAKSLARDNTGILYRDGAGRVHRFKSGTKDGSYESPTGFYSVLDSGNDAIHLKGAYGGELVFEIPEAGGRLLASKDRNGNTIAFKYNNNVIEVIDTLGRRIHILLDENRVAELRDHAGRNWQYLYGGDCLVEVVSPPTNGSATGPRTRYEYDDAFRLISITDPNGQTFLRNIYDDSDRVIQQRYGHGTSEFHYESIGDTDSGFTILRTRARLENGAMLDLKHDADGHVLERTFYVAVKSLSPEDRNGTSNDAIPLVTNSTFNRHGEVTARTYPAADKVLRVYDEGNADPRARGNLLEFIQIPAPGPDNGQPRLVNRYTYEPKYQQIDSITNPRGSTTRYEYDDHGNIARKVRPQVTVLTAEKNADGNRVSRQTQIFESFEHNEAGQIIRHTDSAGFSVEYYYHPSDTPGGSKSNGAPRPCTQRAGGYLARIQFDRGARAGGLNSKPARVATDFSYDVSGNLTMAFDRKANPTIYEYDSHNRVVSIISRAPFKYKKSFRYDANGNLLDSTVSFDHHQHDPVAQALVSKSSTARRSFEYDIVNNVVRQTIAADGGHEVEHIFVRDAGGRIVREIQPMGNAIEYEYDERGLLIAQVFGAGTRDESELRYTYNRNGRLRSTVDLGGNVVRHDYDGFDRYTGFVNDGGTAKEQWRDEAGNVTRIRVKGNVAVDENGDADPNRVETLFESWFQYDELNRRVRVDRAWRDPLTGASLGQSQWDGKDGVISSVIEYDSRNLPSQIWHESGNIINVRYDGINRPVALSDTSGASMSIDYDENNNPIGIERFGPIIEGNNKRYRHIIRHKFDELDRLVARTVNREETMSFRYNSLGLVTEHVNNAGHATKYLHDRFGRLSGLAAAVPVPAEQGEASEQLLLRHIERDKNNRVVARTNAAGHNTRYTYDRLNRLSSIVYPDGTERHFERDGNARFRLVHPDRSTITDRFDAQNRLIERSIEHTDGDGPRRERFIYDGMNRLVAAETEGATTLRRHDTLSRLLQESQSGRVIRYHYDSAGNKVSLLYPSGHEVRKSYDVLGRATEVRDGESRLLASYSYGSNGQLLQQRLGDMLVGDFTYDTANDRICSITYRARDTAGIIDGRKYRYDSVGNCVQAAQLRNGKTFGERYFYDAADRLVKVQYGLKRLSDPESPFEQEVLYELSPTGLWRSKTTRDSNGLVLLQAAAIVNQRGRYLVLGDRHYEYDANGNRVVEENHEHGRPGRSIYAYDYANRLTRVERLDANGAAVWTIGYSYDALNRQVGKRVTQGGETREFERVWNNGQLIEEWEAGKLNKKFVYGAREDQVLHMTLHSGQEQGEYFYTFDGRGSVAGLVDKEGKLYEAYRYDVFGRPVLSNRRGDEINQPISSGVQTANPLLTGGQLYDADTGVTVTGTASYDAKTGQTLADELELPLGPVETGPPASFPWTHDPRADDVGGMSTWTPPPWFDENGTYDASIGAHAAIGGILVIGGAEAAFGLLNIGKGAHAFWGALHLGWEVFWEIVGHGGGHDGGPGGIGIGPHGSGGRSSPSGRRGSSPSGGGGSGPSGGGSPSGGGAPRFPGEPQEHPHGGGIDYGHGDAGGTYGPDSKDPTGGGDPPPRPDPGPGPDKPESGQGSKSGEKEHKPVLNDKGDWVYEDTGEPVEEKDKKDSGTKGQPSPDDPGGGSGEGVDKDWWRGLPNRAAWDALKPGLAVDEGLVTVPLEALGGFAHLNSVLTPPLITVEPGGEGLQLNLTAGRSRSASPGTTTSDGWADKPRSWAEAVAAPRIRDAATSRF